ncbi:MAG: Gfo/Idh/MocA family oxidoreductase, partial [bacterium]|nr:Gfo/Idh/MocA family oxidoreductase [bacterium]
AVIVALPHPLHAEAGFAVLESGKHLFLQKPLCATMQEAEQLVSSAEAHPELCVYCRPSFGAAVYEMRKQVISGAIGRVSSAGSRHSHGGPEVYYAEVADFFKEPRRTDDLWFFDPEQAGVGALFDMGVYAVAQSIAVLGSVVRVTSRLTTVDKPTPLEDTAILILEFENGALTTAETSWCDPARTSFLRIHGTGGKLMLPGTDGALLDLIRPGSLERERAEALIEHPTVLTFPNQHEEWLQHIHKGTQPMISNIWTARHIMEVLLAAQNSSQSGVPIMIESSMSCLS